MSPDSAQLHNTNICSHTEESFIDFDIGQLDHHKTYALASLLNCNMKSSAPPLGDPAIPTQPTYTYI